MATTATISFAFPADAWPGIVACLSEYGYNEEIPNPEFKGEEGQSAMIPNPQTREEFATAQVKEYVSRRFEDWGTRTQSAEVLEQIKARITQRAINVVADTTVTITIE